VWNCFSNDVSFSSAFFNATQKKLFLRCPPLTPKFRIRSLMSCLISWLRASFSDPSSRLGTGNRKMKIKFWIQDKCDSLVSYGRKTTITSHVAFSQETWLFLEIKHTFPPSLCKNKASRLHEQKEAGGEALSFHVATLPKFFISIFRIWFAGNLHELMRAFLGIRFQLSSLGLFKSIIP